MSGERDMLRELYPFLYADARIGDGDAAAERGLLNMVRSSTLAKCREVESLRVEMVTEHDELLELTAERMAARFAVGGKLIAFGNGGSATDADDAAADCVTPPTAEWRALPAVSLPADSATMSAIANDVGLDHVFARQIAALASPNDIALGFSTSGNSRNVIAAFAEARRRGLLTVAFSGYDGGEVARLGVLDACFVARREFVPRIQEGHATCWHTLLELVHDALVSASQTAQPACDGSAV